MWALFGDNVLNSSRLVSKFVNLKIKIMCLWREAFQYELTSTWPSCCTGEGLAIPAYPSLPVPLVRPFVFLQLKSTARELLIVRFGLYSRRSLFRADYQVLREALLWMGVAWHPYTRASQGGVLEIPLFPLPDDRSYVTMTTGTINGWYSLVIAWLVWSYELRTHFGSRKYCVWNPRQPFMVAERWC